MTLSNLQRILVRAHSLALVALIWLAANPGLTDACGSVAGGVCPT